MADTRFEYEVTLDDSKFLKALKNIDNNIDKMANKAGKGFGDTGKSATASGIKIGAVAGIVSSLTTEFINLGKAAIDNLIQIGKEATSTALEFDTLHTRLLGIFDGSKEAADTAFNFIRERSKQLGIDLGELAGAFLPKTESLDQFERVAKIATALAASDTEQGAIGARIALIEALSGTFTSLQRRFEIPKEDIDKLKNAFDTGGIEEFLNTFEKVLKASGKDFDTLANTAQSSINRVGQAFQEKLGQTGAPIVEALQEQFDALGEVLAARDEDFTEIADALGQVLANVVDFIGSGLTDFLANLDKDQVLAIVDGFQSMLDTAFDLVEVLGLLEWPQGFLDGLETTVTKLNEALTTATQLAALAKAERAKQQAEQAKLSELLAGSARRGAFGQIRAGQATPEQQREAEAAGEAAYQAVLLETVKILDETDKAQEERVTKQEERNKRAKTSNEDLTNALLKQRQDMAKASQAADEYAAALEKVNEKQAELELELEQKGSDLVLELERKRFDAMQDFAEKRAQAARKNLQKIEDIERDHARDLEDNDRDRQRAFVDQAKEEAKDRLQVEEDYQQQLADIRERSFYDLEEAAQRRDAIAYLRILRDQEQQVQEAQTTRDRDLEDVAQKGQEKRDELRTQQERENEDARIALDRKLEDQRIAQARELEEIRFAEQIKNEEINTWAERQYEDLKIYYERKKAALEESLAAELAIIAQYEEQKTAKVQEEEEKRANLRRRELDRRQQANTEQQQSESRTVMAGRQHGGPVSAGNPYLVGERGPELFVPEVSGNIVPSTALMNTIPSQSAVTNIDNSRSASLGGLIDPGSLDSILQTKITAILGNVLGGI